METCPLCKDISPEPVVLEEPRWLNSLSCTDNETFICKFCGLAESLQRLYDLPFYLTRSLVEIERLRLGSDNYPSYEYIPL